MLVRQLAVALFLALALSGAAGAQTLATPRTPDGRVDFSGVWTQRWITPLERLPEFPGLVLTPVEAGKLSDLMLDRLGVWDPLQAVDDLDPLVVLKIGGELRSSLIVDPPDGKLPYSAEGKARREAWLPNRLRGADDPEERGLNERCIGLSSAYAPHLSAPIANIRLIVQTPEHFVVHTEHYLITRIIPIGGKDRTPGDRHGDAVARWEGDTLVVETTGFLPGDTSRFVPMSVMMISPATRITERFTQTGPREILYRFTVEDTGLYAQPWTAEALMTRSDERMFEYACHEGNYSLSNILRGGRVMETAAQ
jgi:hypothetical protein